MIENLCLESKRLRHTQRFSIPDPHWRRQMMYKQLSFQEYQNAPDQLHPIDEAQEVLDATLSLPFVKYPHKYLTIAKKLNARQKHVCEIVINKTWRWHKSKCILWTNDFMADIYSERSILQAKNELYKMGLLRKEGLRTYYIDIYYKEKQQKTPKPPENLQTNILQVTLESNEQVDIAEGLTLESNEQVDIPEIIQIENSVIQPCGDVDNSTVQDSSQVQNFCTSDIVFPLDPSLNSLKKQTDQTSKEFKEKKASVCFLISIFSGMEYNHVIRLTSRKSLDQCEKAFEITKDACRTGTVISPAAFFTDALKKGWKANKHTDCKLEVRKCSERLDEKSRLECENLVKKAEQRVIDDKYTASVRVSMSESELSKLTADAKQGLLDGGTSVAFFIDDFAIERQANTILLSRR